MHFSLLDGWWWSSATACATEFANMPVARLAARGLLAGGLAAVVVLVCGRRAIGWLRIACREPIKTASPTLAALHAHKAATPSMGGLLVLFGWLAAMLWFADLGNRLVQAALLLAAGLSAIGVADDLLKCHSHRRGLGAKAKLSAQAAIALAAAWLIDGSGQRALVPGFGALALGGWFLPAATLVIVASSNAVNLTDGLDGLAGGCTAVTAAALAAAAFAKQILSPNSAASAGEGEMIVAALALTGGTLAFLWFNRHPARVFLGDAGALPLGGLLGLVAIASGEALLLPVVGAVFVVEAASVILQVAWFRGTGRRLLRCAPLHHHFEFLGWREPRIVRTFWAASLITSALGLMAWRLGTV
jgi:phospho-N-acetylmuramoyl-pentapeptide-transferase